MAGHTGWKKRRVKAGPVSFVSGAVVSTQKVWGEGWTLGSDMKAKTGRQGIKPMMLAVHMGENGSAKWYREFHHQHCENRANYF